ncbi:MAG: TIGR04013 family B12-binding domain/radical SAM domain-containing protein [Candidatus Riflebacteria bacterium]|nr:TIGR04013 family B12-binding domain/radical SAM domain-containing protein [Candidatus Riflebacteria bacterium]
MLKNNLILRIHNYNIVSFGALLGACSEDLLKQFSIFLWKTGHPFPEEALNGRLLFLYSFMMPHVEKAEAEFAVLKKAVAESKSEAFFVVGGSHAFGIPEKMLNMGFDLVVTGESEAFFPDFLEKWLAGNPPKGIVKIQPGAVDLSHFPGFHKLIGYLPPVEISRGCRFGCAFCAVPRLYKGVVRYRSIDSIVSIARQYFQIQPSRRRIKFLSSNSFGYGSIDGKTPNLKAIQELLTRLRTEGVSEISFGSFPSEVRPEFVTEEVMEIVSKFITNPAIVMGIQTGNEARLKAMGRGHNKEQAVSAVKILSKFGFKAHVDFIIGYPNEKYAEQDELLTFMEELVHKYQVKIHMHTFMPLPQTPWENLLASSISQDSRKRLKALASLGHLDGWWENQIHYSRKKS